MNSHQPNRMLRVGSNISMKATSYEAVELSRETLLLQKREGALTLGTKMSAPLTYR